MDAHMKLGPHIDAQRTPDAHWGADSPQQRKSGKSLELSSSGECGLTPSSQCATLRQLKVLMIVVASVISMKLRFFEKAKSPS